MLSLISCPLPVALFVTHRPRKTRKSCGSFTHTHSPSSTAAGRWSGVQLSNSQVRRAHPHSLLRYVCPWPPTRALTGNYSSVTTGLTASRRDAQDPIDMTLTLSWGCRECHIVCSFTIQSIYLQPGTQSDVTSFSGLFPYHEISTFFSCWF